MVFKTVKHPIDAFDQWWRQRPQKNVKESTWTVLSTLSKDNQPTSRVVLLRDYSKEGFVFYTNYESQKGEDISHNPKVCLLFYWGEQERQVRVQGQVTKVSREVSERYFRSRPRESQLGTWASCQSHPLVHRQELERRFKKASEKFAGQEVELPKYWGGYCVVPNYFEFWRGRSRRLHERCIFKKEASGDWSQSLLFP